MADRQSTLGMQNEIADLVIVKTNTRSKNSSSVETRAAGSGASTDTEASIDLLCRVWSRG